MRGKVIDSRIFTEQDQKAFADFSGDLNPIHIDPLAARRTLTGKLIVHGIHVVLCALECSLQQHAQGIAEITSSFRNPISVGDCVTFYELEGSDGAKTITAVVAGLPCVDIRVANHSTESILQSIPPHEPQSAGPGSRSSPGNVVAVRPPKKAGERFNTVLEPRSSHLRFPHLAAAFGALEVAALADLSRFVGMVCPGRYSLFSSFQVRKTDDGSRSLEFLVDHEDERVQLLSISLRGVLNGRLTAFHRPAPVSQPSIAEIRQHIKPEEFSNTAALILGGSRGLGECIARIIAVGGGRVTVTYRVGREEAMELASLLDRFAPGACSVRQFDMNTDQLEGLDHYIDRCDSFYYFCTPPIFRKKAKLFDPSTFREFTEAYVERFYSLCAYLESRSVRPIVMYYPSSVAVHDHPKDMVEYALAKSAGELLCQDINKHFRKVRVVTSRLPRLATDQTASIVPVPSAPTLETLIPLVRAVASASAITRR